MILRTLSTGVNRRLFAIVLAGLLGSAIGSVVGWLIGAMSCDWTIKEAGCLKPAVYGAIIGESILLMLGVYLASLGGRHSILLTLLAVGGIAAAGLTVTFATGLGGILSSGPHHQDSGEAKIRESTAGVSRKPSSDGKACGCSSKHLCGLTAWNT